MSIPKIKLTKGTGMESFLSEITTVSLDNTNVQFRNDTDLGHLAQTIKDSVIFKMPSGLSQEEQTAAIITTVDEYLGSPEGEPALQSLMQYGSQLSNIINNAFDTLKLKISPEVDALASKVLHRADEYIQRETAMSNIDGVMTPVEPMFTYIDFTNLNVAQISQYAQELLVKYGKGTSVQVLSNNTIKYLFNKVPAVVDIKVSTDTINKYATEIYDSLYKIEDELSTDFNPQVMNHITNIVNTVFEFPSFSSMKSKILNSRLSTGKINEDSLLAAIELTKDQKIYETLDTLVDINDTQIFNQFKINLQSVMDICKLAHTVILLASDYYKDKIVIGNNTLNQAKLTEFQSQGGTVKDVFNYLRAYCNHNKEDILYSQVGHADILDAGITSQSIFEVIESTNNRLDILQNKVSSQLKSITSKATKRAFEDTMKEYLQELERYNPEHTVGDPHVFCNNALKLIPMVSNDLVRYEYANVYDSIYSFYLKVWYPSSLVSTVYYKLGTGLIHELGKSDTVDESTINYAHFSIMTDILTEYITKTMIVPLS